MNNIIQKIEKYLDEAEEENSKYIRDIIKKRFKLTSKDVGVKTGKGGTSTAIRVTIKTVNALPFMKKIEEIGSGLEKIDRDERTHEILGGSNTFIFTELDWNFRSKTIKKIEAEINKKVTDKFMHGDDDDNVITVYGNYKVVNTRNSEGFWIKHPKKRTAGPFYKSIIEAAGNILNLMIEIEDIKNLKKL